MKLNLVTLTVLIVAWGFFGMYAAKLPWTAWRIAGMAIALPAFLLFVSARIELGRAFSVQAKATTLVTTGVYSRIRNPIYFFAAVMILGVIIWTGRPWLLLVFAVLVPVQVVRIGNEESVLTEKFGAQYLEYKRKTWCLMRMAGGPGAREVNRATEDWCPRCLALGTWESTDLGLEKLKSFIPHRSLRECRLLGYIPGFPDSRRTPAQPSPDRQSPNRQL